MRRHGAYARPDAIDPWAHNQVVARRKTYRRIARQMPRTNRALRQLRDSAQRAADSLRNVSRALDTMKAQR